MHCLRSCGPAHPRLHSPAAPGVSNRIGFSLPFVCFHKSNVRLNFALQRLLHIPGPPAGHSSRVASGISPGCAGLSLPRETPKPQALTGWGFQHQSPSNGFYLVLPKPSSKNSPCLHQTGSRSGCRMEKTQTLLEEKEL